MQPAGGVAAIGDVLTYRTTVSNTGNVSLTGLTLADDFASACMTYDRASVPVYLDLNDNGALDPGEPTTTTNSSSGQYSFTNLPSGTYLISTNWVKGTSRASNAPYTLTGVTGGPTTVPINQKVVPDDLTWNGAAWEHLGTFQITGGTLTMRLTDNANGYVYADAVRVEQLSPLLAGQLGADLARRGSPDPAVRGGRRSEPADAATVAAGLSAETLAGLTGAAVSRGAARDADAAARLANVRVRVEDLPAGILGLAAVHSDTIWVDINADGRGWYFDGDSNPSSLIAHPSSFDLLTVLTQEILGDLDSIAIDFRTSRTGPPCASIRW